MNKFFWTIFLATLVLGTFSLQATQQEDGTRVVFYVEHEVEQPEDYVEINIEIKSQQPSLQQAINQAQKIVQNVENIINKYCLAYAKNKKDCQGVVETSEYKIDPIYQYVRKVPTFVAFSVIHETTAKIEQVKNIGKLADDILKSGVSKINSFEWKPFEQIDSQQQAVTEGIQLINDICAKMDMQLDRIVAVSEVSEYEEQQQEQKPAKKDDQEQKQEKQDQQEEQQQEQSVIYRFEIICNEKTKTKK